MRAKAWTHRRVSIPPDCSAGLPLAEVAGDGRARLRIHLDRAEPAAPVRGALSCPASWQAGRWTGEAAVGVMPLWSWGYELHFAVAPPSSIAGRILWRRRRLERLVNGLASALRDATEIPPGRIVPSLRLAQTRAARRWPLEASTGNPSAR